MKINLGPISLADAQADPDPLFVEKPQTTVINLKTGARYDLYIGRENAAYGLERSKWANPFRLAHEAVRGTVLARYRMWLLSQPRLLADIGELRGLVLGCYCHPAGCHGDILAELANAPERPRRERRAAVWASEGIEQYWRDEVARGCEVALGRLADVCEEMKADYTATLEALR